ncbi:MAG TPA: HAD hydrolase-like protein [Nevskiaceae bacterium]
MLFDLDGTLADTAPDLGGAANDLLTERGRPARALDDYRPHASRGARGMLETAFGLRDKDPDFAVLRTRYLEIYAARDNRDTALFPGMNAVLERLEDAGLTWGVVTNKPMYLTTPLIERLGLRDRARCVIGGDSAPHPKPAPDPLRMACDLLRLPAASALYVGDDPRDIQAGHAADMPAWIAGWGYIEAGTDLDRWGADGILRAPAELTALLGIADVRP